MKGMGIFNKIGEGIKQTIQTSKEVREAKKIEKQRLCRVIYIEKNNMVQELIGKLSPNSDFLLIENLNRLFIVDKMYYDKKFIPMAFVSTMFHRTIAIEELSSLSPEIEKEIKKTAKQHGKTFKTLDLNVNDNQLSFDFSGDAFTIMKSKTFEFLEETARRTLYFVFLIGLLLGMFLGSVILAWIQ